MDGYFSPRLEGMHFAKYPLLVWISYLLDILIRNIRLFPSKVSIAIKK